MDIGFGVPIANSGALVFFALQIPGLIFEEMVGFVLAPLITRLNRLGVFGEVVVKGAGFIWVAGFLLWTAPVWVNPILKSLADDGTDVMSPWLGFRAGSF